MDQQGHIHIHSSNSASHIRMLRDAELLFGLCWADDNALNNPVSSLSPLATRHGELIW